MTDLDNDASSVVEGLQADEGYSTLIADYTELKAAVNAVESQNALLEDRDVEMQRYAVGWSREDAVSFYGSVV